MGNPANGGAGKSALVCRGKNGNQVAAIKIFDPELVEKYGRETQLQRIDRELLLRGVKQPHLVQIFDGGECRATGHLFVAMEYLDAPNLEEVVAIIPRPRIREILRQIAEAAKLLEDRGLVHRDIKPSNVAIAPDFSRAVLLDLGVLRPFAGSDLTDEDGRLFIGTLRYSSPEFLLREEVDSPDGWRAITFYQLGGVLHDLIMKRPLFFEFSNPYARLVEAVKSEEPVIDAGDVDPSLVLLARDCLVKSPEVRAQLVTWDHFLAAPPSQGPTLAAKERVQRRRQAGEHRSQLRTGQASEQAQFERAVAVKTTMQQLESIIRLLCAGNENFPAMEIYDSTPLSGDGALLVSFDASTDHQLKMPLRICFFVTIISPQEHAILVSCAACLNRERLECDGFSGADTTEVYRGVYEQEMLGQAVDTVLYEALDVAQESNANADSGLMRLRIAKLTAPGGSDE